MQEFPVVCLIKIWRPAVLPSLSPQCDVGSLQPLYFSRSYLDAQKKSKKRKKERVRQNSFILSQWIFLYACDLQMLLLFFFFSFKMALILCYFLFLWSAEVVPTSSISALAGRAIIIVVNIIVISDSRAEQGFSSLSSVIKELTEL